MNQNLRQRLEQRMGTDHARARLAIEDGHHHEVFTRKGKFFHLENWYSMHGLIRHCLRIAGLHQRGQRNAADVRIRHNTFALAQLPSAFEGYRILHLSDLHVDMHADATHTLIERLQEVDYDLCVMTGDYRARTFGDIDNSMAKLAAVYAHINQPTYAVLGNHDSIRMVPTMEDMGINLLLNEHIILRKQQQSICLAGIDDAHFFHADDITQALRGSDDQPVKILLSHTPEVFAQAADAGSDVFLCGHTHGGQICLPGGHSITLDARCPRRLGKGAWHYNGMQGYTSVGAGTSIVNIRLNCPPEITIHTLTQAQAG